MKNFVFIVKKGFFLYLKLYLGLFVVLFGAKTNEHKKLNFFYQKRGKI